MCVWGGGQKGCGINLFFFLLYPPNYLGGGGGVIFESLCLSICSSGCVSYRVCSISPERVNQFLPNLIWWCIIMRQYVMWKNWLTIFNVKVTVRAYIIKI